MDSSPRPAEQHVNKISVVVSYGLKTTTIAVRGNMAKLLDMAAAVKHTSSQRIGHVISAGNMISANRRVGDVTHQERSCDEERSCDGGHVTRRGHVVSRRGQPSSRGGVM